MRLGISMWSYFHPWKAGRMDIAGFIQEAARLGVQGVELLDFFYQDLEADRKMAQSALEKTGMPCTVFSVSQNFAKPDPEERREQLKKILFGVDEARRFGAGVVRVFAGNLTEGVDFEQARSWIVEGLTEGSLYAAEYDVRLALENHGKLAGRSEQVRELIEEVRHRSGCDAIGANPDTGNFLLVGQTSHEAVQELASLAYMVHFKDFAPAPDGYEGFAYEAQDGSRFVGTAIGEGSVDLEACLASLQGGGFAGPLNIEYEAEEDPFTGVARSVVAAQRLLAQPVASQ